MNSKQILDREYLTLRAKILEIAASLDRIERADGDVSDDDRVNEVRKGLEILLGEGRACAEQVQLLFSHPYKEDWQEQFDLTARFES